MASLSPSPSQRVLLMGPVPPPYGGMAIQGQILEKLLRQDGTSVSFFSSTAPLPRWLRPLDKIRYVRLVTRTVLIAVTLWPRVRQADVVHILAASWVYFFVGVSPAVIYSRIQGKRVVINYRGGDAWQFFRACGWLVKYIFRLATVVTAPSEFLAQAVRECFGIPCQVVPNILDDSVFHHRPRTDLRPRILVTRHMEKIYGVDVALRAFQVIQSHYPDASLWIAGTGSQEQSLRCLVSDWKLSNVRFLGYVPHRELGAIYDQCDVLLNASFVDNFPGSLLEASGAGLVVVSTSAGGIPFMFRHEESALLVEPGDWNGLARAVERVLENPSLACALVKAATEVAEACRWPAVRKTLYATYGFPIEAPATAPTCVAHH